MENQKGSSLVGISLFLIVMGLLITSGLYLLKTFDNVKTIEKTYQTTANIQEAIGNFVALHDQYPCPAPMTTAPDQPGFGIADCSIPDEPGRNGLGVKIGAIPVRTLNLPDKMIVDGSGRRHIYAITSSLTAANPSVEDVTNGIGAISVMYQTPSAP